jgi:predicted nuclease with TOPRIM domain
MEHLQMLETKISALVSHVQKVQDALLVAQAENKQLKEQLKAIEESMLLGNQNFEELNQEKALTKMVVNDLIKTIDDMIDQKTAN